MLYQTDLCVVSSGTQAMQSELAVKIHGAVMKEIPSEYAAKMHTNDYHPFSIFTMPAEDCCTVRVSALCDEASVIPEAVSQQPTIRIFTENGSCNLPILMQNTASPLSAEALSLRVPENGCRLIFVSPAMIRIQSQPSARPDICGYFYSVVRKFNAFENAELDYATFQEAFRAVRFGDYALSSATYQITGRTFPGMTGFCNLIFPSDSAQNRLLRLVLGYASYSGIGSKTTQGMGGILLEALPQDLAN